MTQFIAPVAGVHRPVAAAFWMIGSILGFSALAISGREIGAALDTFEMMLYRSLIGVIVVVAFARTTGRLNEIELRHLGHHALRNIIHFAGQNLWLYALALIPLAQLFAVEFSSPLIVALTAPFFLSERLTRTKLMAVLIGFCGILIVARPFGTGGLSVGLVTALLCAVAFAGTAIATKRLTRRASIIGILFWLAAMQSIFSLICAGYDGSITWPDAETIPWVIVMGLAGLGAHFSLTKALTLAPASVVTPVDFLRLPVIALIGMAFYAEPLDLLVIFGGTIIFFANLLNIRAEAKYRYVTT
ncbi:DMT family transporter [Defluviimonas sp. WL0050]|uniref:DMT family transporter n=1 Tax=Albidovulum litorale TaxID=2984134 RepID=A0ABT2ZPG0_9RHOB|nr:DMT family transporter [Defluviimonas sp. WL0050]MCV2872917.1 DMT family transporter [Defluviimonas sp. WL0050]